MPTDPPSMTDLLEGLAKSPALPPTKEEEELERLRSLSDVAKINRAVALRHQGHGLPEIAKLFDVSTQTIYRWIQRAKEEFRRQFEGETAADNLAGQLMKLSYIEDVSMYEAGQLGKDGKTVDIATGKVVEDKKVTNASLGVKTKFISLALDARKMQIDLLLKTGVIPCEPGRMYHSLEEEGKIKDTAANAPPSSRPRDVLISDLLKKLSNSSTL